jgi:hypothetical protein
MTTMYCVIVYRFTICTLLVCCLELFHIILNFTEATKKRKVDIQQDNLLVLKSISLIKYLITMATLYPTEEKFIGSNDDDCEETNDSGDMDMDFSDLNITSEDIDFGEIDDDLERFQEDDMVKQALQRGIDLKKYSEELATQLKAVRLCRYLCYLIYSNHITIGRSRVNCTIYGKQ